MSTATTLNNPVAMAISPNNNYAYISNSGNGFVIKCNINSSDSSLSGCANTTTTPFIGLNGIALSHDGTTAYIPNFNSTTISICSINATDGSFSACNDMTDPTFMQPSAIAIF
jgi:DNA-binding beta-propeller fold protein YncE